MSFSLRLAEADQRVDRGGAVGTDHQWVHIQLQQLPGVFAGVVGHRADSRNQCVEVGGRAATEALQKAGAAQAEQRAADGIVGGRQQQADAVLEQLDQHATGTDHQGQGEVVLALDADDQFGQRRLGHRLEQHLVERYLRGVGGDALAHLHQRNLEGGGIAQVQRHCAGFGLVRQLRADRLQYQRVTDTGGICHGVLGCAQHPCRYRQAEGTQGLLGLPFVQQLALAAKGLRAQRHPRGLTLFQQPLAVALVGDDAAPGCQAILHTLQGSDATRVQTLARAGGQQLRECRGDEADLAVALQRIAVQRQQQVAFLAFAGERRRVVQHQHGRVGCAAQGAVEHALQGRCITPDGSGEIQRVDQVGIGRQHLGQLRHLPLCELRQDQLVALGIVGDQAGIATGTSQGDQLAIHRQAATGGGLEGFDEAHRATDADHAQALEQAVVQGIGAGQRAGVAERQFGADLRHAGLQRNDRRALLQCLAGGTGEARHVLQAFQVQADGGYPWVVEQHVHQLGHAQLRLVADRGHVGHRQRAVAHGQVVGEVAALGEDRHALLHLLATVGHRPQGRAVQVVEQAIAVGAKQGHAAGRLQQALLQQTALLAALGKARGIADGATGAERGQFLDTLQGQFAVGGDEHRVRRTGQVCHPRHAGDAFQARVLRVDQP
ncbi:hypothetical protein D3C81_964280 [compost metagenome]